jgi:hypothetical protein
MEKIYEKQDNYEVDNLSGRITGLNKYKRKKKKWKKAEEIEKSSSLIFFFFHIGSTKSSIAQN